MSRADIVQMFAGLAAAADLTFVEYERDWGEGIDPSIYENLGKLVTWEESRSADGMLRSVAPDSVVLLFTSSLNQVALRVAARNRGIQTIHVEHGYRLTPEELPQADGLNDHRETRLSSWRTHLTFARSLRFQRPEQTVSMLQYARAVSRSGVTPEVLRASADLRRPDRYVSYSRECFRFHEDVDQIPSFIARETTFTGVPQFDEFRSETGEIVEGDALLIDHQFHNSGLFGWDDSARQKAVEMIADSLFAAGVRRLYIRLHPGDRSGAWNPHLSRRDIRLVSRGELPELSRTVPLVIGTFSTMQLPFASQPHVAMISLEIHPEKGWFPSRRLCEAGVTEPVRTYQELSAAVKRVGDLHTRQKPHKPGFTAAFLERLDGRASQRLTEAILEDRRGR